MSELGQNFAKVRNGHNYERAFGYVRYSQMRLKDKTERPHEIIPVLLQGLDRFPDDEPLLAETARLCKTAYGYTKQEQYDVLARQCFEKAYSINPSHLHSVVDYCDLLVDTNAFEKAENLAVKVIMLDGKFKTANLALLAKVYLSWAQTLRPQTPERNKLNRYTLGCFAESVRLNPKDRSARDQLRRVERITNRQLNREECWKEVRKHIRQVRTQLEFGPASENSTDSTPRPR